MQHRAMWAFMFWIVLASTTTSQMFDRIIGGNHAQEGDSPWAALLQSSNPTTRDVINCGATIIGDRWLLSAAHCFERKLDVDGLVSMANQGNGVWSGMFESILIHPKYDPDFVGYDIALIKIRGSIPLDGYSLASIDLPMGLTPFSWPPSESVCKFVAWGCLEFGGPASEQAHVIELHARDNSVCYKYFGEDTVMNPANEFCAGYYNHGIGLCDGDSGSGLIYVHNGKPVIVGVASRTHPEEPSNRPGIFTRVASFTFWISSRMKASQ